TCLPEPRFRPGSCSAARRMERPPAPRYRQHVLQTEKDWLNMFEKASHCASGRRGLLRHCLLWVFCAAFALTAQAQYGTNVNFKTTYQTFEGWGTSLAWWANVVGGYPDANRNDYVKYVFDPTDGLGLNLV